MDEKAIDLKEKIERCERLAKFLTDEQMRDALEELADEYRAELERRNTRPFMLRRSSG